MQLDLPQLTRSVQQVLPQARAAWLYGSAARNAMTAESDIDLAVLLPHSNSSGNNTVTTYTPLALYETAQTLAETLGRAVDLVNIKTVSPVLQKEIFTTGMALFAQDEVEVAELELLAMAMYREYNERFAAEFAQIAKTGKVFSS